MSRYERRQYFDRLCELRDGYGRSPEDTRAILSIDDAIAYATAVMVALEESDAAVETVGEDALAAAEPLDPRD